MNEVKLREIE